MRQTFGRRSLVATWQHCFSNQLIRSLPDLRAAAERFLHAPAHENSRLLHSRHFRMARPVERQPLREGSALCAAHTASSSVPVVTSQPRSVLAERFAALS
jgi:hypothetical protein